MNDQEQQTKVIESAWPDVEPHPIRERLMRVSIGHGFSVCVERLMADDGQTSGCYRLTTGNLFGSEGCHFESLRCVMLSIDLIAKAAGSGKKVSRERISEMPSFIRFEDRDR